jgi:hypothetical protein
LNLQGSGTRTHTAPFKGEYATKVYSLAKPSANYTIPFGSYD